MWHAVCRRGTRRSGQHVDSVESCHGVDSTVESVDSVGTVEQAGAADLALFSVGIFKLIQTSAMVYSKNNSMHWGHD